MRARVDDAQIQRSTLNNCGPGENRTRCLPDASRSLSQLSYGPRGAAGEGRQSPLLLYGGYSGRRRTFGVNGRNRSFMRACSGVRPPLRWLHFTQQVTRFSQVDWPPRDWGRI